MSNREATAGASKRQIFGHAFVITNCVEESSAFVELAIVYGGHELCSPALPRGSAPRKQIIPRLMR
jgi:hypothetical protein